MNSYRTLIEEIVPERSSCELKTKLTRSDGNVLLEADFTSLLLTIFVPELDGSPIVNNVLNRNVLNANGGTFDTDGVLTINIFPNDNAVLGASDPELHRARIEWIYSSGTKSGIHEFDWYVANLKLKG